VVVSFDSVAVVSLVLLAVVSLVVLYSVAGLSASSSVGLTLEFLESFSFIHFLHGHQGSGKLSFGDGSFKFFYVNLDLDPELPPGDAGEVLLLVLLFAQPPHIGDTAVYFELPQVGSFD